MESGTQRREPDGALKSGTETSIPTMAGANNLTLDMAMLRAKWQLHVPGVCLEADMPFPGDTLVLFPSAEGGNACGLLIFTSERVKQCIRFYELAAIAEMMDDDPSAFNDGEGGHELLTAARKASERAGCRLTVVFHIPDEAVVGFSEEELTRREMAQQIAATDLMQTTKSNLVLVGTEMALTQLVMRYGEAVRAGPSEMNRLLAEARTELDKRGPPWKVNNSDGCGEEVGRCVWQEMLAMLPIWTPEAAIWLRKNHGRAPLQELQTNGEGSVQEARYQGPRPDIRQLLARILTTETTTDNH